jgi:hypothetical protein
MSAALVALAGYGLDLLSTYVGLNYYGLAEAHPFVLTPLGYLFGLAPFLCFLFLDYLTRRWRWGVSIVYVVSYLTWFPVLWNIHLWY